MSARQGEPAGVRVKALYPVPDLAALLGITIVRCAVGSRGRAFRCSVSASRWRCRSLHSEYAFPELWGSLKAVHALRQAPCPVCGETVDP